MKWVRHQRLSHKDWKAIRKLREKCTLAGKREYKQLKEVLAYNPSLLLQDVLTQLCGMAVSMKKSHLKNSTMATCIRKVIGYKRYDWPYKTVKMASRLAQEIESQDMDTRAPATRLTRSRIKQICLEIQNTPMRASIELMANSPMRFCDICATPFERVRVGETFVEVKLQGGKTTKKRLTREKFRIDVTLLSTSTIAYLREGCEKVPKLPVCAGTTTSFNAHLRRRGIAATTYSFRNLWIEETIQRCTNSAGNTDWEKVQNITLHRSIKALKSNYGYIFDGE